MIVVKVAESTGSQNRVKNAYLLIHSCEGWAKGAELRSQDNYACPFSSLTVLPVMSSAGADCDACRRRKPKGSFQFVRPALVTWEMRAATEVPPLPVVQGNPSPPCQQIQGKLRYSPLDRARYLAGPLPGPPGGPVKSRTTSGLVTLPMALRGRGVGSSSSNREGTLCTASRSFAPGAQSLKIKQI